MRVAIHQPNYLPWCGYFAKLLACDVFVYLDDVQMPSGRSYLSRTQVRGAHGVSWLSVPTHHRHDEPIREVRFAAGEERWAHKHLASLRGHYGRGASAREVLALLQPIYEAPGPLLADCNIRLIEAVAGYLGIGTRTVRASALGLGQESSDDRLIAITRALGGRCYVSGKGGQNYQDPAKFAAAGLELEVRVYAPQGYPQLHGGEFVPGLSIVDALCVLGKEARGLLRYG